MLRYPADRDVVYTLLNALAAYFSSLSYPFRGDAAEEIAANVDEDCRDPASAAGKFLEKMPEYAAEVRAMLVLSCMNSSVAAPILSHSTASGTLMRQKLEPVITPILQQVAILRGQEYNATVTRRRART
jgi:hypothetical protein